MENIKSIEAIQQTFITFLNQTRRNVDVIWINYQGNPVVYKTLLPGQCFDVDTFVSHPWIFQDADTKDKLVADSKDFYLPPPWNREIERLDRRENQVFMVPRRARVHITIPMYSLLERAMQVLRNYLLSNVIHECMSETNEAMTSISTLGLPETLKNEFVEFVKNSFQQPT